MSRKSYVAVCYAALLLVCGRPIAPALAQSSTGVDQQVRPSFPADHKQLAKTISFADMESYLKSIDGKGPVRVSVEGKSVEGRPLYVVHLNRGAEKTSWRVFFYAQQHGDEVSGKDALLYMTRAIVERPELLPKTVDLWLIPMVNPDGAAAGKRRNGGDIDLNRDHTALSQPETQMLHRICRTLLPHIAVDCHEFTRDSSDYRDRGWGEWPIIMMDGLNNPLFDPRLVSAALRWVEEAVPVMQKAGHAYTRYVVGDAPPDGELRYSAPDVDDGRNGLGMYGGLSFIIESGVKRSGSDPDADLGQRVDAYLTLLWRFIRDESHRAQDIETISRARQWPLPPFIPTNYLWASVGPKVVDYPVIDLASGQVRSVPTANFMQTLVVKKSVSIPAAYAIEASVAATFRPMLERHGIAFEELSDEQTLRAERCRLLRVEEKYDDVYNRYEGRQIVVRDAAAAREFAPGSLLVSLNQDAALRAVLVLEPTMLFGLYQYPAYRDLVSWNGTTPVWRILPESNASRPESPSH